MDVSARSADVSVAIYLCNSYVAAGSASVQRAFKAADFQVAARGVKLGFAFEIAELDCPPRVFRSTLSWEGMASVYSTCIVLNGLRNPVRFCGVVAWIFSSFTVEEKSI